ncbi:unnamed protein product, partial [Bubo scandiacus]
EPTQPHSQASGVGSDTHPYTSTQGHYSKTRHHHSPGRARKAGMGTRQSREEELGQD